MSSLRKIFIDYILERGFTFLQATFKEINYLQDSGEGYWDDLRVPLESSKLGGSKDPDFAKVTDNGSGSQGVFAFHFDSTTEEELYFAIQMPHTWKEGTTIHPHIHWLPKTNGTAGQRVQWSLEYTVIPIGGDLTTTNITSSTTIHNNDIDLVAGRHYITGLPAIDMTGCVLSCMILCRIFRDATALGDDYTDDAIALEFDVHYQSDSPGSRQEYIK